MRFPTSPLLTSVQSSVQSLAVGIRSRHFSAAGGQHAPQAIQCPGGTFVTQREHGTVKWFSNTKGYGFITRQSGEDVFVHYSSIKAQGFRTLNEGQRVEFNVVEDAKGPRAQDVTPID
jgi:CspA family cold shock protein